MGTSVEDNPQIFSSKLVNLPGRFFFYVRRGSAKLCSAKTSNSTAGLRNETSPDTKSRDCWGTIVVQ